MHAPPSKVEPRTGPQAKPGQQPSPEAQPRSRKPSQPKLTQQQLEAHLWGAANILRGKTAGQDYKNYILSLMFFKRLCDQWAREADEAIAEVEKQQGMELNDRQRAVFRKRGDSQLRASPGRTAHPETVPDAGPAQPAASVCGLAPRHPQTFTTNSRPSPHEREISPE